MPRQEKVLSIDDVAEFRRLRVEKKYSFEQLGRRFGVSTMTIQKWLKALSLPTGKLMPGGVKKRIPTEGELEQIVAMRKERKTWFEIGPVFGVSEFTVYAWAKEYKLDLGSLRKKRPQVAPVPRVAKEPIEAEAPPEARGQHGYGALRPGHPTSWGVILANTPSLGEASFHAPHHS